MVGGVMVREKHKVEIPKYFFKQKKTKKIGQTNKTYIKKKQKHKKQKTKKQKQKQNKGKERLGIGDWG